MRRWIALAALLFPLLGLACEGTDRRECKKQFRELVSYRAQAIDTAFGDLFGAVPAEIQIKFVTAKDPEYILFGGREVYAVNDPKDIHIHIRKQIAELYPALKDVEITHGWGGYVGITMPRKPFVREVMPVVRVDDRTFERGPEADALQAALRKLAGTV